MALNQPDPASHLEGIQQSENNGAAVQLVTNKVLSRCRKILAAPEENFDSVSPFFIHSVYSVAVTSTVLGVEEPASSRSLIEKTLQKLNERWKLAGVSCCMVNKSLYLWETLTSCDRRILGANPDPGSHAAIASCTTTQKVPDYSGSHVT